MKLFKPALRRILVIPQEKEELSKGGIFLPEDVRKAEPIFTIVEVAEDCQFFTSEQIGLQVVLGKFTGHKFTINEKEHILIDETSILGYYKE